MNASCKSEAAGLPPKAVQSFAGHSSLQVTMDRYGHLFRSENHARIMDQLSCSLIEAGEGRPKAQHVSPKLAGARPS
jgi:hypothetical protein